jgi:tetratricopeptide (TPR) repeat protein
MRWIIDSKRWDVLEKFEQLRGGELHGDRKLLYFLAAAKHSAGKTDEGLKLAKQALDLPEADAENRVIVARALATLGRVDWAEWEYRHAVEDLPQTSVESIEARREWAIWLHDGEQYKQAADVIQEFFDALAKDRQARSQFNRVPQGRSFLNSMSSRHDYYLACYHESRKEFDLQRQALKRAAERYDDDPDVLIAMYRSPGADEEFRKETLAKIADMSQRYLALIEQDPDDPTLLNQWAWLVSNTEGDYAKAIECSRKSLELSPDEPSYLDTLGRCYYAVGDLENATKSQRKAVELSPHYRIMQRQLKQFEKELAAQKKQ